MAVQTEVAGELARWHALDAQAAAEVLLALCGSSLWAETLAAARPFESVGHLEHVATNVWFLLGEADWLEAFGCHPRIGATAKGQGHADAGRVPHLGGLDAAREGFAGHSLAEQAAVLDGLEDDCAMRLVEGNKAYEERFGFIYIVFASGRSAEELLAVLESRLGRDRITELHEAAREQHKITALRMDRWLSV